MKEQVGFIGLGNMGQPMARRLLQAGYDLQVYNRSAQRAQALVELGARQGFQVSEVVSPGGIVITMVTDDQALESLILSPEFCTVWGRQDCISL